MKVRLITIKRPVEISSRKFLLKLFRIIELYRKIILLKQNIVNTKKSHKLIFLRNVKTTLLSFECVKVLIIVIRRTFTPLEPLFFKRSFFTSLFWNFFIFLLLYNFSLFLYFNYQFFTYFIILYLFFIFLYFSFSLHIFIFSL